MDIWQLNNTITIKWYRFGYLFICKYMVNESKIYKASSGVSMEKV